MRLSNPLKRSERLPRGKFFARLPQTSALELSGDGLPARYEGRLLLAREPFLTLAGPELGEKPFFVPLGSKLMLGIGLEEGWGEFECEVVSWAASGEGSRVMLRCPEEGKLYQRRRYPRYPAHRTIDLEEERPPRRGETRNLSKSGLCVSFSTPLPKNHKLSFALLPETETPIPLEGQVVWQQASPQAAGYLAGINLAVLQEWPKSALGEKLGESADGSGGGN